MKVDMRDLELPPGRTDLRVEIGMGEIEVLVPEDLCVTTEAEIGVGAVNAGDGEQGGVDLDVDDDRSTSRPASPQLHVIADVGSAPCTSATGFVRAGTARAAGTAATSSTSLEPGTSRAACLGTA